MGQDNSKSSNLKYAQDYNQVQMEEHPFMGTVTHLTHRTLSTKHLLRVSKFASEPELSTALKKGTRRKQLSHKRGAQNIVKLTQMETDRQNELCGITYYLYMVYEDYQASLAEMLRLRMADRQPFAEQDVMECLRGVCGGLLFLQDNGYKNYTLTKESIVRGNGDKNSSGSYKVLDIDLSKQILPYYKLLNGMPIERGTYLAPQLLQQLANKNNEPEMALKSDIFSLGMLVLEMCLLEQLDCVYNYNRLQVDGQAIGGKLATLKNYSPLLRALMAEMLQFNEQERIGAVSLREKLNLNSSDNKSAIDGSTLVVGNSNVTQRTHKLSYPHSNAPPALQHTNNARLSARHATATTPRVEPVEQLKPVSSQPMYIAINGGHVRKNQTFEVYTNRVNGERTHVQPSTSLERYRQQPVVHFNHRLTEVGSVPTVPFFYPLPAAMEPRPMTVSVRNGKGTHQIKNKPVPPAIQTRKNQQGSAKLNEMKITELYEQRKAPTKDSPARGNQPPYEPFPHVQTRQSFNNDNNQVINSINLINDQKQKQRKWEQQRKSIIDILAPTLNEISNQYESPPKHPLSSAFASDQNTPIRKVQAIQSIPRPTSTIRECEEELELEHGQARLQVDPNMPRTYGKHHFTNGAVYEGEFDSSGNFYGNGRLSYPSGKICYSGGWLNNSFHGFGALYNEHPSSSPALAVNYENFSLNDANLWVQFEGEFYLDKKNGFGTLYFCNGDKFTGCFVRDCMEGYGTFTTRDGRRVSGIWNHNVLRSI